MSTPLTSYNEGFLDGWASAYHRGAAVLFGLIWMAEAIRARRRKCPTCRCMLSITTDYCGCCAQVDYELTEEERAW